MNRRLGEGRIGKEGPSYGHWDYSPPIPDQLFSLFFPSSYFLFLPHNTNNQVPPTLIIIKTNNSINSNSIITIAVVFVVVFHHSQQNSERNIFYKIINE
jgi:hypothetical protein